MIENYDVYELLERLIWCSVSQNDFLVFLFVLNLWEFSELGFQVIVRASIIFLPFFTSFKLN